MKLNDSVFAGLIRDGDSVSESEKEAVVKIIKEAEKKIEAKEKVEFTDFGEAIKNVVASALENYPTGTGIFLKNLKEQGYSDLLEYFRNDQNAIVMAQINRTANDI